MTADLGIKRGARYFLIAFAGLFLVFLADQVGILAGIDTYMYDMSFRIRGTRLPSDRIIIVAIDKRTLEKLGRWPLRRIHYAHLIERLEDARVIGFDILMAEPSEDDDLLREAIRRHGRIILPVYVSSELEISLPLPYLEPYRTGHVHVEQGTDNVAREIFHTIYLKGFQLSSLSAAAYETFSGSSLHRQEISPGNREQTSEDRILQRDLMRINYYGVPGTFRHVSLYDVLKGNYPPHYFEGTCVLVGITAQGIGDRMSTPFSQQRNKMAGVEIHANMLNNLLDGSSIKKVPEWLLWLFCSLLAAIMFLLFMKLSEARAILLLVSVTMLLTALIFFLFAEFNRWMNPSVLYCSFLYMYLTSYLSKLNEAAGKLDGEYVSVIRLLGRGEDSASQNAQDRGIVGFLSIGGINEKIQGLLQVEHRYGAILENTVQKRTRELAEAFSMISTMSNEMVLRLTKAVEFRDEDTGDHIARVGLYSKEIAEALGMNTEFVDSISFASALHDIGKIGIPDGILLKPGRLTAEEWKVMQTHTVIGQKILSNSTYPKIQMSAAIALNHHERWNGTGYPNGKCGDEIPIEARIVSICDHYDAMRSKRPYKDPFSHEETLTVITDIRLRGLFDPDVLDMFIKAAPRFKEIYAATFHD